MPGGCGGPGIERKSSEVNSADFKVLPKAKHLTRQRPRSPPVAVKLTKYELEKMFKRA